MKNRVFPQYERQPSSSVAEVTVDTDDATSAFRNGLAAVEEIVSRYPIATVGVGLCAGVLLGCWIKRR